MFTQFQGAFSDNALRWLLIFPVLASVTLSESDKGSFGGHASLLFAVPFLPFATVGGWMADRFSKRELGKHSIFLYLESLGDTAASRAPSLTAEEIVTDGTVLSRAFSCLLMVSSTRTGTEGKTYTRLYELAPAAGQKVDLHSLTEATVASHLTVLGSYATVDPTAARERIRAQNPRSWFLHAPSKRSVPPHLRSSSMRWITDNDVLISEAIRAMPAL